jgi:hypothetical protein
MKRTSTVQIRRIFPNVNSDKNQVNVQFVQFAQSEGSNVLVAAAQGSENFKPSMLTAIFSFNADKCEELFGTTDADYSELPINEWPSAAPFEAAVGSPVAISVVENTTQDPMRPKQTPKINPQTGEELTFNGQPIYRHTSLVLEADVKTELLKHNGVKTEVAEPANVFDAFGAPTTED